MSDDLRTRRSGYSLATCCRISRTMSGMFFSCVSSRRSMVCGGCFRLAAYCRTVDTTMSGARLSSSVTQSSVDRASMSYGLSCSWEVPKMLAAQCTDLEMPLDWELSEREVWEVSRVVPTVSREQTVGVHRGVRTDHEVCDQVLTRAD